MNTISFIGHATVKNNKRLIFCLVLMINIYVTKRIVKFWYENSSKYNLTGYLISIMTEPSSFDITFFRII
jgi:hypothetical protein